MYIKFIPVIFILHLHNHRLLQILWVQRFIILFSISIPSSYLSINLTWNFEIVQLELENFVSDTFNPERLILILTLGALKFKDQ